MNNPMWCDGCRSTGAIHCAHPDQCGNMLSATASADQWKAWLDDLPLPEIFDPAVGRLQDFITALTTLIDVPQPAISAEAERDRLAADNARLAAQVEALTGAWNHINSAPPNVPILAYEDGYYYKAIRRPAGHPDDEDYFESWCGQPVVCAPEPTHWMPLPMKDDRAALAAQAPATHTGE